MQQRRRRAQTFFSTSPVPNSPSPPPLFPSQSPNPCRPPFLAPLPCRHSSLFYRPFFLLSSLLPFFFFFSFVSAQSNEQIRQKCLSPEASLSCGGCISVSPDCAWCADPRLNSSSQRCDAKWQFSATGKCPERHLYSPSTEIKVAPQHNLPLGGRRADGVTIIQLEPQQVEIRMKPGDLVEVPFRYLHKLPLSGYEVRDFTIQTSEFRALGVEIEFSVECNGERIIGRVCPGVKPEQKIQFFAKISLRDCSRPQLVAVSVGVYGYNTVSAVFITPVCGCECEQQRQQERRSPRCSYTGNLVCGLCQCDKGKGGEHCECDLDKYGVDKAEELTGLCREHKQAQTCSGRGICQCGKCQCQASYISGRYCECDSSSCPLSVSGQICSGKGTCQCGKCVCEQGYSGEECGCDDDPEPCTEHGVTCFNNGYCECGKCSCNVGWTGPTCNIPESLPEESTAAAASSTSTESGENEHGNVLSGEEGEENVEQEGAAATLRSEELLPTQEGSRAGIHEAQQAGPAPTAAASASLSHGTIFVFAVAFASFFGSARFVEAIYQ